MEDDAFLLFSLCCPGRHHYWSLSQQKKEATFAKIGEKLGIDIPMSPITLKVSPLWGIATYQEGDSHSDSKYCGFDGTHKRIWAKLNTESQETGHNDLGMVGRDLTIPFCIVFLSNFIYIKQEWIHSFYKNSLGNKRSCGMFQPSEYLMRGFMPMEIIFRPSYQSELKLQWRNISFLISSESETRIESLHLSFADVCSRGNVNELRLCLEVPPHPWQDNCLSTQ